MKDLYTENCKIMKKEIKEDTQINRKIFHAHGLEEYCLNVCITQSRFNAIPIKITMVFSTEIEQS